LKLWSQVRAFLRLGDRPPQNPTQVAPRDSAATAHEQVVAAVEGPLPLAEMYVDLLRHQGIPAMLSSAGAGRGALGGAGVQARVMVPAGALARAREILGIDESLEREDNGRAGDERKDGGTR
jgi:hypothetical protein